MNAGLTQQQLAQMLDTEQTRISEWERGVMTPRPSVIPQLAAALGLDALEFLGADPESPSIEDMRLAAGLTMHDIADQLGMSLRRYRGIEIGATRRDPPQQVVEALAHIFAVPIVTVQRAVDAARP